MGPDRDDDYGYYDEDDYDVDDAAEDTDVDFDEADEAWEVAEDDYYYI